MLITVVGTIKALITDLEGCILKVAIESIRKKDKDV